MFSNRQTGSPLGSLIRVYGHDLSDSGYEHGIRALNVLEDESGEHTWAHKTKAPLGIVGGCGLRGDDFIEGFAVLFECRHLVADSDQQVAVA